jgi:hypothetical protein
MSALAAQFGPGLLVAALAAPLVVLVLFLVPGLRSRLPARRSAPSCLRCA